MGIPLTWDAPHNHDVCIKYLSLRVSNNYYKVNSGRMETFKMVAPGRPITKFYQVYEYPAFAGVTQNSNVRITTTVNDECLNPADYNNGNYFRYQNYWNYQTNPIEPVYSTGYNYPYMSIWDGGDGEKSWFNYWQSNRGDLSHIYDLDIISGPYEGGDGKWYNLKWYWQGNENTITRYNLEIADDGTPILAEISVMGSAINVTPNKPFVHRIYEGSVMVERTIENVVLSNKEMGLVVK